MKPNSSSTPSAFPLKVVVIGGTGLIGAKVVTRLRDRGHLVTAASPSSGVNAMTGEGLAAALSGAQVVVDVSNPPSFEETAVMEFFRRSGENLAAAETAAGVTHHVALSVVGVDRPAPSPYFRAKLAQEALIKSSGVPYTIVRATQFFEFTAAIAGSAVIGGAVVLPPAMMQPIAAADVSAAVAEFAMGSPRNAVVEIAGPESIRQDELVRRLFRATGDSRAVVTDAKAPYFGATIDDQSLTPGPNPQLGATHFGDWLARTAVRR